MLALVQRQVPGVKDVFFSHGGCGFYHCVVAMRPVRAGWSKQAIMATFAAFPPLKMVTVVDDDVDIRNPMDVEWAMTTRLDPLTGVITVPRVLRPRPQSELPELPGDQDRLRLHASLPLHLGIRPRRLQGGVAGRLRTGRRRGDVMRPCWIAVLPPRLMAVRGTRAPLSGTRAAVSASPRISTSRVLRPKSRSLRNRSSSWRTFVNDLVVDPDRLAAACGHPLLLLEQQARRCRACGLRARSTCPAAACP